MSAKSVLDEVIALKPTSWINSSKRPCGEILGGVPLQYRDIIDAELRWRRFSPYIKKTFPETSDGIIESSLVSAVNLQKAIEKMYGKTIQGNMMLKCDNMLLPAGSIKSRGGIYEVLKLAEMIGLNEKLISSGDDYSIFAEDRIKDALSQWRVAVGSTGNLGLSIGIISSTLGFNVTIHMSRDAKEWKKKILRSRGAVVVEHENDYSAAVEAGRMECIKTPKCHFVDDEQSTDLFLGYSVAALRLREQLSGHGIIVDEEHPLHIYLPCGVGGAPGGITFGIKHVFGDAARCFFVEPTHAPCMMLAMLTDNPGVRVSDFGIEMKTDADGLAVGSPSRLVYHTIGKLIDGLYTIDDDDLYRLLYLGYSTESYKMEPSAASSLMGPIIFDAKPDTTHIAWLTGGMFVPEEIFMDMLKRGDALCTSQRTE